MQFSGHLPYQTGLKLEGLQGGLEMVHAVYRIPAIPDRVKTRRLARRLRDGSQSIFW
jgi:hypothetical protein